MAAESLAYLLLMALTRFWTVGRAVQKMLPSVFLISAFTTIKSGVATTKLIRSQWV